MDTLMFWHAGSQPTKGPIRAKQNVLLPQVVFCYKSNSATSRILLQVKFCYKSNSHSLFKNIPLSRIREVWENIEVEWNGKAEIRSADVLSAGVAKWPTPSLKSRTFNSPGFPPGGLHFCVHRTSPCVQKKVIEGMKISGRATYSQFPWSQFKADHANIEFLVKSLSFYYR